MGVERRSRGWTARGRIYELQNRLDDEELDSATELVVREQLEALTNPDLDEAEQVRRLAANQDGCDLISC